MEKVKISIIIPVYNVERYIKECLISVINQTIKNKEIILIDDASTDKSLNILKEYEHQYPNLIKLIKLEHNKGQGYCRNLGLKIANGEYIGFVDSDDIISPNMFEKLVQNAIEQDSDIAITEFDVCDENINKSDLENLNKININKNIKFEVLNNVAAIKKFLKGEITGSPCTKIYKRDLLLDNEIKFPVGRYYEDMQFILKSIIYSKNIIINYDKLYYYRTNLASTTNKRITNKHIFSIEKAMEDINDLYRNIQIKDLDNSKLNYEIWINTMLIDNQILFRQINNLNIELKYSKGICNIKNLNFFKVIFSRDVIIRNKLNYILIKLNLYIKLKELKQIIKKRILK